MKNTYMEQINANYKRKDWCDLNIFISNCIDLVPQGKFTITKKIANKLTLETIIRIACKHKAALDYIPDYGVNDTRALIIDFMKDGKLSREYKKPKTEMLLSIFRMMVSYGCSGYAMLFLNEVGMTKEEYLKAYKHNKYDWLNVLGMASGFKFRPTDQDIRKLYSKNKDLALLQTISKFNDKEAKTILTSSGNDSTYSQTKYLSKHLGKFSDKVLFNAILKCHDEFDNMYGNNNDLVKKITDRLIKAEQPGLYTIIKWLYGSNHWAKDKLKWNLELSHLKDEDMDTFLSLLPEDKAYDGILKYLKLTDDNVKSWNIK